MMALATFYKAFSLKPRGKHIVSVCLGTACHVRGGERILGAVERELGIKGGETDEDLTLDAGDGRLPGGLRAGADRRRGRRVSRPDDVGQGHAAVAEGEKGGRERSRLGADRRIL